MRWPRQIWLPWSRAGGADPPAHGVSEYQEGVALTCTDAAGTTASRSGKAISESGAGDKSSQSVKSVGQVRLRDQPPYRGRCVPLWILVGACGGSPGGPGENDGAAKRSTAGECTQNGRRD